MSNLFFNMLLFVLNVALKAVFTVASLRDHSFRKKLAKNQFTLLIKTIDGKSARYYRLIGGMMKSKKGDFRDPDVSVVWTNTKAFNTILLKINPLLMAQELVQAVQNGKLVVEVNPGPTSWFVMMVGEMLMVYRYFFSRKRG